MLQWKGTWSCIERRISWVFSSWGRKLGVPLQLLQGPQGPTCVASGKSSLHSSCKGALGIPLQLVQGIGPHLELRLEPKCSSPVLTWISGFLWSFNRGVRPHFMWRHGTPLPSRGVKGLSGFLSSWHKNLGLFLEVPRCCHTSVYVLSRYSGLQSSQCRGISLICSGWGNLGVFELRHNSRECTRVSRWDWPPLEGWQQHWHSFTDEAA